jgi:hypothetical protein
MSPAVTIQVVPVCVLEVKPYYKLRAPGRHVAAYEQVQSRINELLVDAGDSFPLGSALVSCVGSRFSTG